MRPRAIHSDVVDPSPRRPYANVTIKTDVADAAFSYLLERQDQFPGVVAETATCATTRTGLGAQLFGTAARDLAPGAQAAPLPRRAPARASARTGSSETYDKLPARRGRRHPRASTRSAAATTRASYARGSPSRASSSSCRSTSACRPADACSARSPPRTDGGRQGGRLRGHGPAQRRGPRPRLLPELRPEHLRQAGHGVPLRSSTRRPTARRCSTARSRRLYPTGSTFKLDHRDGRARDRTITPEHVIDDPGLGEDREHRLPNAGDAAYGAAALRQALQVSSDVFFYTLGARLNGRAASRCRRGRASSASAAAPASTSPASSRASCPTPHGATRSPVRSAQEAPRRRRARRCSPAADRRPGRGDNVNLAVGQGDLQATPLQMAAAYSTIVNGGHVVTPHLGMRDRGRGRARRCRRSSRPRRAREDRPGRPAGDPRRPARRRDRAGRHLGRRLRRASRTGLRQDGHGRAPRPGRPVLVRRATCRTRRARSSSR